MPELPDPTRIFICRTCQRETHHWSICRKRVDEDNVKINSRTYSWRISSTMKCRDCGTLTFLIDTFVVHNMGGDPGVQNTVYFPPLPFRIRPIWLSKLPKNYLNLLKEVYNALDNSLYILASSGTRTVIDCLITEQIGDIGGFEEKVKELVNRRLIDNDEKDILLALIDAGSASMHRSFYPSKDLINHMIDILEKIVFKFCIEPEEKQALKKKAQALRKKTPKRL